MNNKQNKTSSGQYFILVVILIFVIRGCVNSNSEKHDSSNTPTPSPIVESTPSPTPIQVPSLSDKNLDTYLRTVAREEYGEESLLSEVVADDTVTLKVIAKENLTSKMSAQGVVLSMWDVLEQLSNIEGLSVSIITCYSIMDDYGNTRNIEVMRATFSDTEIAKINWESKNYMGLLNIADDFRAHESILDYLD